MILFLKLLLPIFRAGDFMQPLRINNIGRPSYYREMIRDCSHNVRLTGRESSLLAYYADCATGFAPALAEITKQTGIRYNKIAEVRQALFSKGLISVGREISPAWSRIRAFAMMPRLSKHDAMVGRYACALQVRTSQKLGSIIVPHDRDAIARRYLPHEVRVLSDSEQRFLDFLNNMTEQEYYDWLSLPVPKPVVRYAQSNVA